MGAHQANATMSNTTKGAEREAFISQFLQNVLPPIYRFGTGDATDVNGNRSGQLDVVVEYPFGPSLPAVGGSASTRLYLAETVAAVVEVKSSLPAQMAEALYTLKQLSPLRRSYGSTMSYGSLSRETIPFFVATYKGWKTVETVRQHVDDNPGIEGILVLDNQIFVSSVQLGSIQATGPLALLGLIHCLHRVTNSLQSASTSPIAYGLDTPGE